MAAKTVEALLERSSESVRGHRLDLRQEPVQLGEKPRVLALQCFELLRPGGRETVERREEDALLEVEVPGESRSEALESMASVGTRVALERREEFPLQHAELAVLLRDLLR